MRLTPVVVLSMLALGIAACGTGRDEAAAGPATGTDPGRVGQLHRLAMLPVVYTPGSCQWPEAALRLDQTAVLFLRDWKGYEIVRPSRTEPALQLARALGEWQRGATVGDRPPAALRGEIADFARAAGADGVLVLASTPDCSGTAGKALSAIAGVVASTDAPLESAAYEARRGSLVWRHGLRPTLWAGNLPLAGPSTYAMQRAIEELYQPMDNAVPAVLGTPARPK